MFYLIKNIILIKPTVAKPSFNSNNNNLFVIGYGKCGVAVIRISGSKASLALKEMIKVSTLKPRIALLRKIHDPETKEVLDKGLCLWFPGTLRKFNHKNICLWKIPLFLK